MQPGGNDEIQAIRNEMDGLRAEVRSVRGAARPWWVRAVRPKTAKRLTRIGLVALMLAMPVMVSASHQFSDVPTSNTYHASIARLYGARLTGGCTATKFCPDANVTRGQMAAFLNRGLGRAAGGQFGTFDDDWTSIEAYFPVADVTLTAGGGTGGTAHAWATGNVAVWTNEPGVCPCEVEIYLVNDTTGEASDSYFATIGTEMPPPNPNDPDSPYAQIVMPASFLFTVDSGVPNLIELVAKVFPTTPPTAPFVAGYEGELQVLYVPFGAAGGNPRHPTTTQAITRGHR